MVSLGVDEVAVQSATKVLVEGPTTTRQDTPKRWYILIGVDFYLPGTNRSVKYPSLRGAVQDVEAVRDHIAKKVNYAESEVLFLTSSADEGGETAKESKDKLPTYENIVGLLEKVITEAKSGDFVYIHYSGHGGRVKTSYTRLIGKGEYDEAIVPYDIAVDGLYLRDVDFNVYLQRMSDRKLSVNVVLDCCHSGGATRGDDTEMEHVRGTGVTDDTVTERDRQAAEVFLKANMKELESLTSPTKPFRGISSEKSYWTILPPGQELLAACRFDEQAREIQDPSGKWHGALTYHLLSCLETEYENELSLQHLHQRIHALITKNPGARTTQSPIYAGDGEKSLFGLTMSKRLSSVVVRSIDKNKMVEGKAGVVTLNQGTPHGMSINAKYRLFPWDFIELPDDTSTEQYPLVKVFCVRGVESEAVLEMGSLDGIDTGSQAVEDSKIPSYTLGVKFSTKKSIQPSEEQKKRLKDMVQARKDCGICFKKKARYIIGFKDTGGYLLLLSATNRQVPGVPLQRDENNLFKVLEHVATYEKIRDLKSEHQNLDFKFEVTDLEPLYSDCKLYRGYPGKEFKLEFKNTSGVPLHISIFDFSPEWGIQKIHPPDSSYQTVENQKSHLATLNLTPPTDWDPEDPYVDCLKVFVTDIGSSFECLERSNLMDMGAYRGPDLLQEVLDRLEQTRGVTSTARQVPRSSWATFELKIAQFSASTDKKQNLVSRLINGLFKHTGISRWKLVPSPIATYR